MKIKMERSSAGSSGDDVTSDFSPAPCRDAATERRKSIVICCFVVLVVVGGIGATMKIINSPEYRNSFLSTDNGDDIESKTYYDIKPPQSNYSSSWAPTLSPTSTPTNSSGDVTMSPSASKITSLSSTLVASESTSSPSETPKTTQNATKVPILFPTTKPTTRPSPEPKLRLTTKPSTKPSATPTANSTKSPIIKPAIQQTIDPTLEPTTKIPTAQPSSDPTKEPSIQPTKIPTTKPTTYPTIKPTIKKTMKPTTEPTINPTKKPIMQPTFDPTTEPTEGRTIQATIDPTYNPTNQPTMLPTINPTADPTTDPTTTKNMRPTRDPTTMPTRKPTINPTEEPTVEPTKIPTIFPTNSPLDLCHNVSIIIQTDFNTSGIFLSDATEWSLRNRESGSIVLSNGPLAGNQAYQHDICLPSSMYTFNITDYQGDGFGDCSECGYFIYVDNVFVGGSVSFSFNEEVTFPVPYDGNDDPNAKYNWCTSDFYLIIVTDQWPWETSWDLADSDTGEIVLSGGPYYRPFAVHSHRSCLRKGTFIFTIYDLEADGIESPGFYLFYAEDNEIVNTKEQTFSFGNFDSTTFNFPSGQSGEEI